MLPARLCKLLQLNNVRSANEKNANCRSIIFLTMCKTVGYAPLVPRCTSCILAIQLQNILCIETGSDMHKVSHTWIHWRIWGGHLCNLHEVELHCRTMLLLFSLLQLLYNFWCNAHCFNWESLCNTHSCSCSLLCNFCTTLATSIGRVCATPIPAPVLSCTTWVQCTLLRPLQRVSRCKW